MSEETSAQVSTRKQSVKGYASKVFKQSSVSAVSAIVSSVSIPRKIFFALVFLLFTAGFLYQCIKFLAYVLTYPTVVTVEIRKPDFYITPAYTFCNHNKIKRSKYCAKYPDNCVSPTSEFCDKYPIMCKENDTKIVKEEYHLHYYRLKADEVLELSQDLEDLCVDHKRMEEKPEGPFIRFRDHDGDNGHAPCYSYRGRVDNSLDPHVQRRGNLFTPAKQKFVFDSEEDEVFSPHLEAGVFMAIHSQFDGVTPFKRGIFLKPGYQYHITITMHEEKLLEHPYQTDCLNYTEKWLKNNKSGPRSQVMCQEQCMVEIFERCMNCTSKEFNYPSEYKICEENSEQIPSCLEEDIDIAFIIECVKGCKDECLKMKYEYQVQERIVEPMLYNVLNGDDNQKESRYIHVYIEFEDSEIYSFEYKPQYQDVEVFSYIGGFIGIWLGVSLMQVADFFESAFRITRYVFRKGSMNCSRCRNSV